MTQPQATEAEQQPTVAPISDQIETPDTTGPGFFRRLGRGLWNLFRILLILAILAGIGLGHLLRLAVVKERYLDPIAANSNAVETAESACRGERGSHQPNSKRRFSPSRKPTSRCRTGSTRSKPTWLPCRRRAGALDGRLGSVEAADRPSHDPPRFSRRTPDGPHRRSRCRQRRSDPTGRPASIDGTAAREPVSSSSRRTTGWPRRTSKLLRRFLPTSRRRTPSGNQTSWQR